MLFLSPSVQNVKFHYYQFLSNFMGGFLNEKVCVLNIWQDDFYFLSRQILIIT